MASSDPNRPSTLKRASSRTQTALKPLQPEALFVYGIPNNFEDLYAGPVDPARFPPINPILAGPSIRYPFDQDALQVFAFNSLYDRADVIGRATSPAIGLIVDLGKSCEIARIELYGNLLLPPVDAVSGPLFNFGLPRTIGVAVAEVPHLRQDLHRVWNLDAWLNQKLNVFHPKFEARDFRARWGWSTIHLPPTFGRYLYFHFADLPLVYRHVKGHEEGRGVDIQRLVIYPRLEDVDHNPSVESTLLSTRQTRFPQSAQSNYWIAVGEDPPAPQTHQSVAAQNEFLPWPSVFSWLPVQDGRSEWIYSSDLVELDTPDRIVLTFEATTDEVPVLDAIRFYKVDVGTSNKKQPGEVDASFLRFRFETYTTSDQEAAWSSDLSHPSWRLVNARVIASPAAEITAIDFAEPVRARYVRCVIALERTAQAPSGPLYGRFSASGAVLGRCHDFVLAPEADEDIQLDSVLLRLRGKSLAEDYAFINGFDAMDIAIEARVAEGPFEEIRGIRHLLDAVENSNARVISNPRFGDKPIQRYTEHVQGTQSGASRTDTTNSESTNHSTLPDGSKNITVSRTGSTTSHVKNAKVRLAALNDPSAAQFPSRDTAGVSTKRIYELGPNTLPDPSQITDFQGMIQFVSELLNDATNSTVPVNFGVGISGSGSVQEIVGVSGGVSLSVGASIGGGNTLSIVRGDQASVAESQTTTLLSESHQTITSTGFIEQSRSGNSIDDRSVVREDHSEEVRKLGVSVRYGGQYEDVILITIPARRQLSGRSYSQSAADKPPTTGDMVRVRVGHLPAGVKLDVEFRGLIRPRREA